MTLLRKVLCKLTFHPEIGGISSSYRKASQSRKYRSWAVTGRQHWGLSCSFSEKKGLYGDSGHIWSKPRAHGGACCPGAAGVGVRGDWCCEKWKAHHLSGVWVACQYLCKCAHTDTCTHRGTHSNNVSLGSHLSRVSETCKHIINYAYANGG